MSNDIHDFDTAETARKNEDYVGAGSWFGENWRTNPNADDNIGWRYVYCLRKANHLEFAEKVARQVCERFPQSRMARSELIWTLYTKELKPADAEQDLARALRAGKEILGLQPEGLALHRTAMLIAGIAKDRNDWQTVLTYTGYVEPQSLETQRINPDGRSGMSDREVWYINRARALSETGSPVEAHELAETGLTEFSRSKHLARTQAQALLQMGEVEIAAAQYRDLIKRRDADWYFKSELADIERTLGHDETAYSLLCDALTNPQGEEYKIRELEKLATLALQLGKFDVAAHHVAWAKSIRVANGWKIPASLSAVETEINRALQAAQLPWPDASAERQQLKRLCEKHWHDGRMEGKTIVTGIVQALPEGKDFGFIRRDDTSEDIFVKVASLPREACQIGAKVSFTLEQSFDKRKNRESWRAADVKVLRR